MNPWLQFLAVLAVLAGLVSALLMRRRGASSRVLPPPRSKRATPTYQQTNAVAKLFIETLQLKESSARWPRILQGLNPDDDPQTRTILLELRTLSAADPRKVLLAIEGTCLNSKQGGDQLTRMDLLERAKSSLLNAQQAGSLPARR